MSKDMSASFEGLRKQAKRWLKAIRLGDAEARAKFDALVPRHSASIGLREVQQALARERGFESWARLKEQLELDGLAALDDGALLDELLNKACHGYDDDDWPSNRRRAERILARHPGLALKTIHSAAVCGELTRVRALLDATPDLVNQKGGPRGWEPLLFVCYGRLPAAHVGEQSLAVARLLLERGADPNAHWLAGDAPYRFTALTGAMGQGELGQSEHPHAEALARMLLEAGADANDSQGLYDTCLRGDETRWLELLSEFGLDNRRVNWAGDQGSHQVGNLSFLISYAASNGQTARLSWLLAHGADPNARSVYTGKACYESALLAGFPELAAKLLEHGAEANALTGLDAFVAAAARGDREAARALALAHPDYLANSEPLVSAASRGDARTVGILLDVGMDPNRPGKYYLALNAGSAHRAVCELLLEHGADPRGRSHGATAAGWALHGKHVEEARFLAEKSRLLLDAVMTGQVALARDLIVAEPACVHERSPSGNTPLHVLPEDPDTAEALLRLLLDAGADPGAVNEDGQTPQQALEANGRDDVADRLEALLP